MCQSQWSQNLCAKAAQPDVIDLIQPLQVKLFLVLIAGMHASCTSGLPGHMVRWEWESSTRADQLIEATIALENGCPMLSSRARRCVAKTHLCTFIVEVAQAAGVEPRHFTGYAPGQDIDRPPGMSEVVPAPQQLMLRLIPSVLRACVDLPVLHAANVICTRPPCLMKCAAADSKTIVCVRLGCSDCARTGPWQCTINKGLL